MSCDSSSEIYIEILNPDGGSYIKMRPQSMQFQLQRGKFDYLNAKFSDAVAKEIQPHTVEDDGDLARPLPVRVHIQGEAVYRMLWVPESPRFTDNNVHIEFHDIQKYLTRGTVDWKDENIMLKDAYERIFEKRDTTNGDIFAGIKFPVSEDTPTGIVGVDLSELDLIETEPGVRQELVDKSLLGRILGANYIVDFDKVSPWEAITELNDKFGVDTWVDKDGYLNVGTRKVNSLNHLTAPDDERVWKLRDYSITPPRDPVIQSVVRGNWADDPSETRSKNFMPHIERLNVGTQKFRTEGVAYRPNVEFGQTIVSELDVKKNALEPIARRKMMKKQREQWDGHIEIDPEFSGSAVSDLNKVSIGDSITTIPPDSDNESSLCETNIKEMDFNIVGVQHVLTDSGNWGVRLNIIPKHTGDLSTSNIETKIRYYDPAEKEYIEGDVYDEIIGRRPGIKDVEPIEPIDPNEREWIWEDADFNPDNWVDFDNENWRWVWNDEE